jgi:Tfp pilus assembly protein PilP
VLRFVGTVTQNGSTIAFISAPDNKIYQIKAGDIIGDHDSEVTQIDSDRISMIEQYSENGSTPMKRVVTLQLKEVSQ